MSDGVNKQVFGTTIWFQSDFIRKIYEQIGVIQANEMGSFLSYGDKKFEISNVQMNVLCDWVNQQNDIVTELLYALYEGIPENKKCKYWEINTNSRQIHYKTKLAILIPTFLGREHFLQRLLDILKSQIEKYKDDVVLFILGDNREMTTGWKRNQLTQMAIDAGATHRAFIDCDDTVTEDYLDLNMPGVYGNYDCNSLVGIYSLNGVKNPNKCFFYHSIKHDRWWDDETGYYRSPSHINVIKLSLIGGIKFPEKNFGEDGTESDTIRDARVLKNEYQVLKPTYHYLDRTKINGI